MLFVSINFSLEKDFAEIFPALVIFPAFVSLTRNVRIQHKDHNRPTLQVDSQNFTLQDEVIYRQAIPLFWG